MEKVKVAEKTGMVVFAFGQPKTISSNVHLAVYAKQLALMLGVKRILTQKDISIESISNKVIYIEYVEESSTPPSTLVIAEKSLLWARRLGLERVIVVAAPPHEWRCFRDMSRIYSGDKISLFLYRDMDCYVNSLWYDPESLQSRTRNWFFWWTREALLRLLPFALYKKIAR